MAATPIELRAAARPNNAPGDSPRWDHARELRAVRLTDSMRERRHTAPTATVAPPPLGWRRWALVGLGVLLLGGGGAAVMMAGDGAPARSRLVERSAVGIELVAEGPAASLRALAEHVVACHEASAEAPDEVTAHVVVEATGAVGAISLAPSTDAGLALRGCVEARATTVTFPPLRASGAALVSLRVAR